MVGGTKLPPQDSVSEPWGNEQSKEKTKPFHEGKKQNLRPLVVSLDNADTVIEGGPPQTPSLLSRGTHIEKLFQQLNCAWPGHPPGDQSVAPASFFSGKK